MTVSPCLEMATLSIGAYLWLTRSDKENLGIQWKNERTVVVIARFLNIFESGLSAGQGPHG